MKKKGKKKMETVEQKADNFVVTMFIDKQQTATMIFVNRRMYQCFVNHLMITHDGTFLCEFYAGQELLNRFGD